jgi:hypothetical protein
MRPDLNVNSHDDLKKLVRNFKLWAINQEDLTTRITEFLINSNHILHHNYSAADCALLASEIWKE